MVAARSSISSSAPSPLAGSPAVDVATGASASRSPASPGRAGSPAVGTRPTAVVSATTIIAMPASGTTTSHRSHAHQPLAPSRWASSASAPRTRAFTCDQNSGEGSGTSASAAAVNARRTSASVAWQRAHAVTCAAAA